MSRIGSTVRHVSLVLLACTADLEAQRPSSKPKTSVVEKLGLSDSAAKLAPGIMRELRCRGKPGIELRIDREPSPRDPRMVAMALRYERPPQKRSLTREGMGLVDHGVSIQFAPGTCTWNTLGSKEIPPEPGVVYFDVPRDAQAWATAGNRDTTIEAARFFPDVTTLPRYLADSSRYWVFYVDQGTNVSISFGAWPTGGGLAGPGLSGNAVGPAPTATASRRNSAAGAAAGPVSKASPVRTAPPLPGARSPGNPTAATATVVRAPLQLEGVSSVLGSFTLRFSARANASPTVLYSTDKPVRDRQTGRWFFPGGRPAYGPQDVGGGLSGKPVVLPGSPAGDAGAQADVARGATQAFRAQYTATSRPGNLGRGMVYYYIITVPATSGFAEEQYVGRLMTVSQTVRMTITSFTVLKSSFYAKDLNYELVAWTDVGRGGPFEVCQSATCDNTGDYLRLLVFATPPQTSGSVFTTPGWNTQPSVIMGIARREFDLRTIPEDRPLRAFTLRSESGDIEFEVQGTLEVVRR